MKKAILALYGILCSAFLFGFLDIACRYKYSPFRICCGKKIHIGVIYISAVGTKRGSGGNLVIDLILIIIVRKHLKPEEIYK